MSDWFDTGKSAVDRANQKSTGSKISLRFYLKPNSEATALFVDGDNTPEEPIGNFKEHAFETTDGKWPNFCTCVGPAKCPVCKEGLRPYDAWPLTIVQLRPSWTGRDGKEHKFERKLLIAKKEAMQKILRFAAQRKGLVGTVWNIFRTGDRAYTIGDDWQFVSKVGGEGILTPAQRRVEMAKPFDISVIGSDGKQIDIRAEIPTENVQPLNYRELLKPRTYEELMQDGIDFEGTKRRAASWGDKDGKGGGGRGGQRGGGGPGGGGKGSEDEVPY
jgi:hypothetical protein